MWTVVNSHLTTSLGTTPGARRLVDKIAFKWLIRDYLRLLANWISTQLDEDIAKITVVRVLPRGEKIDWVESCGAFAPSGEIENLSELKDVRAILSSTYLPS
jgi:hypothetical protein